MSSLEFYHEVKKAESISREIKKNYTDNRQMWKTYVDSDVLEELEKIRRSE